VIARNSCGEAYATTTLTVNPRQDDYRAVLKHNVKRDYINSKEYRKPEWVTHMEEIQKRLNEQTCSAKFTQEVKDQRGVEGMKLRFEACFAGNPAPEVTWEFDGKLIENSKNMQVKNKAGRTTLTIFEAAQEHNGYYTCRVKNQLGSDRTRGLITVKSPAEVELEKEKHSKAKLTKLVKSEESKAVKKSEPAQQKPTAKQPEPAKQQPAQPAKTWGKAGSKKTEPAKAEPEPAQMTLKKAEPKQKPIEPEKSPSNTSLKPTPKQGQRTESPKPESVQLKGVKKEVCE
jgi:hypothetical protein